jgi:Uma2 family endonuclease
MATQSEPYYSPEEYLALERAAEYKSEYLAGHIFAMAGASENHNTIAANILWSLPNQFQGRPCRVYMSDMRVRVAPNGLYTYLDVTALCGPREFADDHRDTLLNPTVIFEVLSPSTEAEACPERSEWDRGEKFAQYWKLESLTDYVLVAQDRVRVEHFARQGNGWYISAAGSLDEILRLESIGAELPLVTICENVEWLTGP